MIPAVTLYLEEMSRFVVVSKAQKCHSPIHYLCHRPLPQTLSACLSFFSLFFTLALTNIELLVLPGQPCVVLFLKKLSNRKPDTNQQIIDFQRNSLFVDK